MDTTPGPMATMTTSNAEDKVADKKDELEDTAARAEESPVVRQLARLGLGSRAAVYLILSGLVLEIAVRGAPSSQADSQGAFQAVDHRVGGPLLLTVLGLGLLSHAAWRGVQAVSGRGQGREASSWQRLGWAAIGVVYVFLCVEVFELVFGSQPQGGPSQHPGSFSATLLRWPLGPELLGLVGVGVGVGGVCLVLWGLAHDYTKELESSSKGPIVTRVARPAGAIGNAARGVAVALVGASLVSSAISDDPQHAKSLDAALQSLTGDTGGPVLLAAIGVGLLGFFVLSVIEAAYRRP